MQLAILAEAHGFSHVWTFDSHLLWQEPYATLNEMFGNRTICGIGRGDSAVRVTGGAPTTLATLRESIHVIREHMRNLCRWFGGMVGNHVADFVPDEIVDRFCLLGTAEDHIKKLTALARIGVDQFAGYLQHYNKEETLGIYGESVIPAMTTHLTAAKTHVNSDTFKGACSPW